MMQKISILVVMCLALLATDTMAQGKRREVRDAIHKLKSPNAEEVLNSVMALAAANSREAVGPLTDLLRSGPRNDVTNAIIQALGSLGQSKSIDTLIEYLHHRRPDARLAAIYALANFKDKRVTKALEGALRDSSEDVRSAAALTLGQLGDKNSLKALFHAFDRGVFEAAISIGQIGTPADADALADYLGKVDVKVLLPGFDEFLKRPQFPKKAKKAILDQLFERVAGPDVRRFAVAFKASFPEGTDEDENELYKTVSRIIRRIQPEE